MKTTICYTLAFVLAMFIYHSTDDLGTGFLAGIFVMTYFILDEVIKNGQK